MGGVIYRWLNAVFWLAVLGAQSCYRSQCRTKVEFWTTRFQILAYTTRKNWRSCSAIFSIAYICHLFFNNTARILSVVMFCTFRKRTPAQKRNPSDVPVLISFSLRRYTRNVLYIIYVIYCLELVRSNNNKRIYIYIYVNHDSARKPLWYGTLTTQHPRLSQIVRRPLLLFLLFFRYNIAYIMTL